MNEKVRIKVRLTEKEKSALEKNAALCGLTQSEYVRQLCRGRTPHPKPSPEFWELMNALYSLHNTLERLAIYFPKAEQACRRIERLVLVLQEVG